MVIGRRSNTDGPPLSDAPDRALLLNAIARLPAGQRAVIRRSYYLGWSVSQIALDLGVNECDVKAMLHHGLRSIRQMARDSARRELRPDQESTPAYPRH
jgi:DNA-directed RNA polymerase specialized sigma24 family protein